MNISSLSFVAVSFVFVLSTSEGLAADKALRKKVANGAPTTVVMAPSAEILWEPTAFGPATDRLPPNYLGLDPAKFLDTFKMKVGSLKKGEFETTAAFAKRIADKDALLSPINTSDLYAFRIEKMGARYDADALEYKIYGPIHNEHYDSLGDLDSGCRETTSYGHSTSSESKAWVTCKVAPVRRDNDSYVGTNAYGASRTVQRTRGRDLAVAIPKDSAGLRAFTPEFHFTKEGYRYQAYVFNDRLSVPLEKARDLKGMKVAVLFIGRVSDAMIVYGRDTSINPKIGTPMDIVINEEAVPFELKAVVYYVVKTGEILGQRAY